MASLRQLKKHFSSAVRSGARHYVDDNLVQDLAVNGQAITAHVVGEDQYNVHVTFNGDGEPNFDCGCEVYQRNNEPCQHIWATLTVAEDRGLLHAMPDEETDASGPLQVTGPFAQRPSFAVGSMQRGNSNDPLWKRALSNLKDAPDEPLMSADESFPADSRMVYVVNAELTRDNGRVCVDLATQRKRREGVWHAPKRPVLTYRQWLNVPDAVDRQIVQMLYGSGAAGVASGPEANEARFFLDQASVPTILRQMCDTGRAMLKDVGDEREYVPLSWDDGPTFELWLDTIASPRPRELIIRGTLRREEGRMELDEPTALLPGGYVIAYGRIARMETFGAFELATMLRDKPNFSVPRESLREFVEEVYTLPGVPRMQLPEEAALEEVRPPLKCALVIAPPDPAEAGDELTADLSFKYEDRIVRPEDPRSGIVEPENKVMVRDRAAEGAALRLLASLGVRSERRHAKPREFRLLTSKLNDVVLGLVLEGWDVQASGSVYRQPGAVSLSVASGIDWFDLHGSIDFGGQTASLPKLLAAIRKQQRTIVLDDGSIGVLPTEWLKQYAPLAGIGTVQDDVLRFTKSQIGFLDALLAAAPAARFDEVFAAARRELTQFEGIEAADPVESFKGTLRPYQRDGLGWLQFLRKFGFGGCLADDMGLGKTVQVLAMLEARRQEKAGTSLVVVPRSLVFNWQQEATRFAPDMKVLDQSGPQRTRDPKELANYDTVLTTYGTLRRDAAFFKDFEFDYVVLDEAQAIKNSATASAKATRLLKSRHRLAMSGTPIENNLAELWSLFEFLNPGMLGSSAVFDDLANASATPQERGALGKALRPFILRRTKGQVAPDLPEKIEQTIFCELGPEQRKMYDELREHYRHTLMDTVSKVGMGRATIQVLEALLRLRQAACHPGLIDPEKTGDPSAKMDAALAQIKEVMAEDHKVLLFSQFTSFLAIVRQRLDAEGITYEYLDGQTRDRQSRVEHFQSDPECKLFLISLKAGGLGLNLTAADYVYLLDPWWNPAVEAQAIDRTHRIGQTRSVFAYRVIAKDTVEEKVLELQAKKRDLAEAIIGEDNSLISRLQKEDLEALLG
ncbi:MAG TPA: SNF2-related protein [Tepidisphaeraceae bacterium]|nr:SNF2-related protein [Tepidisphaeraceae bacterium]